MNINDGLVGRQSKFIAGFDAQGYVFRPSSVADLGCLSRIKNIPVPGSASKKLTFKCFYPKKLFLSSRKYDPGCSSRIRILIFYPSRIKGSKGNGSRIRNTATKYSTVWCSWSLTNEMQIFTNVKYRNVFRSCLTRVSLPVK